MSVPVASPPLDAVTTALLDLFDLSGRTVAGKQGFDGVFAGNPAKPLFPYWVLYQVAGGSADPMPDLDRRGDEVTAVWQVTAVSNLRNQAQQLARVCRDLVLARTADGADWAYPIAAPTGWQVVDRNPDPALAGVDRVGDVPTAVFSAPVRFTLTLAPA